MTDEELPHINKKLDNPMEKWAKDMKRPFLEKETYNRKKCTTLLVIRELQMTESHFRKKNILNEKLNFQVLVKVWYDRSLCQ